MLDDRRDAVGDDDAPAAVGNRLLLMGVAPMHDKRRVVQTLSKELRIGGNL